MLYYASILRGKAQHSSTEPYPEANHRQASISEATAQPYSRMTKTQTQRPLEVAKLRLGSDLCSGLDTNREPDTDNVPASVQLEAAMMMAPKVEAVMIPVDDLVSAEERHWGSYFGLRQPPRRLVAGLVPR